MNRYKIEIELLTEAIFGSGHSVPGSVDLEIVYDEYGFPFMKAKTFKGNLREIMKKTIHLLGYKEYKHVLKSLLGEKNNGVNTWKNLRFSDCRLTENIRNILKYAVKAEEIEPSEIKEALTEIRSFTSIEDDGSYKKGTLRHFRVIKKGLMFVVDMECERELSDEELAVLAVSLRSLRHIGTMRTRGKGEVNCSLLLLDKGVYRDITDYYIDKLMEGVKSNA